MERDLGDVVCGVVVCGMYGCSDLILRHSLMGIADANIHAFSNCADCV